MHIRIIFLLLLTLAGCGAPVGQRVESDIWSHHHPYDLACCKVSAALAALAEGRKYAKAVWAPPQLVRGREPGGAWLPHKVLLRVEVSVYRKMSCKGPAEARKHAPSRFDDQLVRIDPSELERLGAPESVAEIWIVPYEMGGVFRGSVGPAWFGNFLRHAGEGGAVYFPPYQDCAAMSETFPVELPRHVFLSVGQGIVHRGEKGRVEGVLRISPRSPFVARMLELCEATATQRKEDVVSYHIPAWYIYENRFVHLSEKRQRYTDRIEAQCAGVKRSFEYGPTAEGFTEVKDFPPVLKVSP